MVSLARAIELRILWRAVQTDPFMPLMSLDGKVVEAEAERYKPSQLL